MGGGLFSSTTPSAARLKNTLSLLGVAFLLLLFFSYSTQVPVIPQILRADKLFGPSQTKDPNKCVILYYTDFYRWKWMEDQVLGEKFFLPAKERSCIITSKPNYLANIDDYDALVFFQWNINNKTVFPSQATRRPDQLYIVHYLESPQRSLNRSKINPHSQLFNLTMSYRLDSDIKWYYGRVFDLTTHHQVAPTTDTDVWRAPNAQFAADKKTQQMVAAKKKLISWIVSNCQDDPSDRMQVVKSLQKFAPVDIYGKCGRPCKDCRDQVGRDYFFYLAFENSLAVDYVSEKAFMMLGRGTIPVVYGGADYSRFLPPKSYINAQDFKTTKELADFLVALSKNPKEYLSYFWWTQHYNITLGQGYGDLCGRVKEVRRNAAAKVQFYKDLEAWEQNGMWRNRSIGLL